MEEMLWLRPYGAKLCALIVLRQRQENIGMALCVFAKLKRMQSVMVLFSRRMIAFAAIIA
jgi:hypothetical protein